MDIALCHDNNYAPYSTVVIASILDHNENAEITFHLLHTDLTAERCAIIKSWVESFKGKKVCFYQMKKESFADFPIDEHTYLDYGAYIRLYLGECLKQIDKVLYLDCDVIVNGSLCELWNTDISDYAVAGVRDRINDYIRVYNRLDYPMSEGYINSGMMLINLKKWREDDFFKKAQQLACEKGASVLKNHDQDIINAIYHGRFLYFLSVITFLNIICMWKNGCILTESIIRRLLMLVKILLSFISVCRKNLGIMNVLILLRNCTINTAK